MLDKFILMLFLRNKERLYAIYKNKYEYWNNIEENTNKKKEIKYKFQSDNYIKKYNKLI